MAELAFSVLGERFEPPVEAAFWRVRRFKASGRGTPEVVFSTEGSPLIIPIDTGLKEFRDLVGSVAGRYRLDCVTDEHKSIDGATAAYLQLSDRAADGAVETVEKRDDLLRDVVKGYSDIVKSITDRFASVMESAAVLLRAADGAGLPAREPQLLLTGPTEVRNATGVEDEGDDGDSRLADVLEVAVSKAVPLLSHTLNTKVLGLTPEQSLALLGGGKPAAALPSKEEGSVAPSPTAGAAFISHLAAIRKELSDKEVEAVQSAMKAMSPKALEQWRQRLEVLPPGEAAAVVRSEIQGRAA